MSVISEWWTAASESEGLGYGLGADGGPMLRLYEELDSDLIHEIKELNEDDPKGKWKAVRVRITVTS